MAECGRCCQPVFFAEAVQAIGKHWHRACFVCSNPSCSRSLDSRSCNDNNNKPYCNHCYKSLFGPKGVGYGIGSGVLSTATAGSASAEYERPSYYNNNDEGYKVSYGTNKDPVTSSISYGVVCEEFPGYRPPYLRTIDDRFVERNGTIQATIIRGAASLSASTDSGLDTFSDTSEPCKFAVQHAQALANTQVQRNNNCGRCGKTVYDAEKVLAAGNIWHKNACFTCSECNKRLESRTLCERDGALYCNACYARAFGPKGYGHGVGAGILQLHQ